MAKYFWLVVCIDVKSTDSRKKNIIVNWITKTRKSGEHLRTTYGNTGQVFRPY